MNKNSSRIQKVSSKALECINDIDDQNTPLTEKQRSTFNQILLDIECIKKEVIQQIERDSKIRNRLIIEVHSLQAESINNIFPHSGGSKG